MDSDPFKDPIQHLMKESLKNETDPEEELIEMGFSTSIE